MAMPDVNPEHYVDLIWDSSDHAELAQLGAIALMLGVGKGALIVVAPRATPP